MIVDGAVDYFGIVAISIMVVSYTLEKYNPVFILIFAIGCGLAALYAYFLKSYPFLIAESLWALIALYRWRNESKGPKQVNNSDSKTPDKN